MIEQNQSYNGRNVKRVARRQAVLISGLLVIGGAVVGIAFVVKALRERQARIKETQDEIVSLLDRLDPLAKARVAEHVVKAELGKR